jgi:hypothetical protein
MADWRELLQRHPEKAREMILRPLLADRIVLKPRVTPEGRFYESPPRCRSAAS